MIKNYQNREEIEADYKNFAQNWEYDAKAQKGEHISGLKVSRQFFEHEVICYENLPEWVNKCKEDGLSQEETQSYQRMLKNQFIIMYEKNPYQKNYSWKQLDEKLESLKKTDLNILKLASTNNLTEQEISKMYEELTAFDREHFEKVIQAECKKIGKTKEETASIITIYHKKFSKTFGER